MSGKKPEAQVQNTPQNPQHEQGGKQNNRSQKKERTPNPQQNPKQNDKQQQNQPQKGQNQKPRGNQEAKPENTQVNKQNPANRGNNVRRQKNENAETTAPEPAPKVSGLSTLFSHIPVVHRWTSQELLARVKPAEQALIHPALLEYALQVAQDVSYDEDERTRLFMKMMIKQIRDEPIQGKEKFSVTLMHVVKCTMGLLSNIRINAIGIGNAVRFLKKQISSESAPTEPEKLRASLIYAIDHFIEDKVDDTFAFIAKTVAAKVLDNDVILTYGYSPVICEALKQAKAKFRVIVVDSRPNFPARRLVEQLPDLDVRYVLISGLSYVMPEVTKVLIEPCGILSNNAALTPIGTAMISMVAHECGKPVLFACSSYRFVSEVRIDALARNEILAPEFIQPIPAHSSAESPEDSEYMALVYDVTPGMYVDVVICELGNIPVNSISTNIKYIQESYTMFSKPAPFLSK